MGRDGGAAAGERARFAPARSRRVRTVAVGSVALLAAAGLALSASAGAARVLHLGSAPVASIRPTVNVNGSSFDYVPGSQGDAASSVQYLKGAPGALTLMVFGAPPAGTSDVATLYADLANGTGQAVTFPGGASVRITLTRNGQAFQTVTVSQPALPSLAPGQRATLQGTVALPGPGDYTLTAALTGA